MIEPVYSSTVGNSADIMHGIVRLYVPKSSMIADLNYSSGVFWRDVFYRKIIGSDINCNYGVQIVCDARKTPYKAQTFQAVVLDPPYGNGSTTPRTDGIGKRYNCLSLRTTKEILKWYKDASTEAVRILKRKGVLIIKCQNMVDSGRQQPIQYRIFNFCTLNLGLDFLDDFALVQTGTPVMRHKDTPQQHSRKNRSMFLVFGKNWYTKRKHLHLED